MNIRSARCGLWEQNVAVELEMKQMEMQCNEFSLKAQFTADRWFEIRIASNTIYCDFLNYDLH